VRCAPASQRSLSPLLRAPRGSVSRRGDSGPCGPSAQRLSSSVACHLAAHAHVSKRLEGWASIYSPKYRTCVADRFGRKGVKGMSVWGCIIALTHGQNPNPLAGCVRGGRMLIRRVEFVLRRGPISRRGIGQLGIGRMRVRVVPCMLHSSSPAPPPAPSLLTNVKRPEDTTLPW
jgi:hypothetical protein